MRRENVKSIVKLHFNLCYIIYLDNQLKPILSLRLHPPGNSIVMPLNGTNHNRCHLKIINVYALYTGIGKETERQRERKY